MAANQQQKTTRKIKAIEAKKLAEYEVNVKDYCFSHGLFTLIKAGEHDAAAPLPVTLFPTQLPRDEFAFAFDVQKHFNSLIYAVANDHAFLVETFKNVIQVDEFTRRLWQIYEKIHESGGSTQPIKFCIVRNDFMLDQNKSKQNKNETALTQWSHIEINTVSCSFGSATSQVARLHKHMLHNESLLDDEMKLPVPNSNLDMLADSLRQAWLAYGEPNACILFLVSDEERNIGDQRLLEHKCVELDSRIKCVRGTFADVTRAGRIDPDSKKKLFLDDKEISVVYYRAGYDPKDYVNEETDWAARLLIERSLAIKCPDIAAHLVGAKIMQQVLSEPGVLERFITDDSRAVQALRATFVDLYSIHEGNVKDILKLIDDQAEHFVLKPQREGGGNNIYKEEIRDFVKSTSEKELESFILMRLVTPYLAENYIIKSGQSPPVKQPLISELGVYGFYIGDQEKLLVNETCGYLLRSKSFESNEGGVAAGFSAIDSVSLI